MELTITKRIGQKNYHFKVEGKNLHEMVMESNKLSFPDHIECCGICGSPHLTLGARKAKDKFSYTFIRCLNYQCNAELTLGQQMENPDVSYLRKNEQGQYDWKVLEKKN